MFSVINSQTNGCSNIFYAMMARDRFVANYAWAIPTPEIISRLAERPLVEIGAGLGLWAHLIRRAGGDVVAYDAKPASKRGRNRYVDGRPFFPVLQGGPRKVGKHSNRRLFLCWPPYQSTMALDALRRYRGDSVVVVGEYQGCTGCEEFWGMISDQWRLVDRVAIPRWMGLNDAVFFFNRPGRD